MACRANHSGRDALFDKSKTYDTYIYPRMEQYIVYALERLYVEHEKGRFAVCLYLPFLFPTKKVNRERTHSDRLQITNNVSSSFIFGLKITRLIW